MALEDQNSSLGKINKNQRRIERVPTTVNPPRPGADKTSLTSNFQQKLTADNQQKKKRERAVGGFLPEL